MTSSIDISETIDHVINGSQLSIIDAEVVDKMRSSNQTDNVVNSNSQKNFVLQSLPNDFGFANTNSSFATSNSEFTTPSAFTRSRTKKMSTSTTHTNPSASTKRDVFSLANDSDDDDSKKRSKNLNITRHIQAEASIAQLFNRIQNLETTVHNLNTENNNLKLQLNAANQTHSTEIFNQMDLRIKALETRFPVDNNIMMDDMSIPIQASSRTFADLFKVSENKKITEPLHDLINILSNNEEEKRKREYNLIVFGLNVKVEDTSFVTLKKLLTDIGVDHNCIAHSSFLRKKDQVNENAPIKMVAYDLDSKFFILKSARKLREYNSIHKTKIVISQDMSEVDRQVNRKLIEKRNDLNSKLNVQDNFYYGIRNNKVISIIKNNRS